MVNLIDLVRKAETLARENSPMILTALGVSGTLTTAYRRIPAKCPRQP